MTMCDTECPTFYDRPNFAKRNQRSKWKIPPQVTDIFLLENSATPLRTVALRPCEVPSIRQCAQGFHDLQFPQWCCNYTLCANLFREELKWTRQGETICLGGMDSPYLGSFPARRRGLLQRRTGGEECGRVSDWGFWEIRRLRLNRNI